MMQLNHHRLTCQQYHSKASSLADMDSTGTLAVSCPTLAVTDPPQRHSHSQHPRPQHRHHHSASRHCQPMHMQLVHITLQPRTASHSMQRDTTSEPVASDDTSFEPSVENPE